MINPTHLIKKLPNGFHYKIPYINRHGEVVWLTHHERGWLGSGVKDKNGVEIFEGDIVRFRNVRDTIFYEDGIMRYGHSGQLNLYPTEDLEVVGHIATEENNDNRT